MRKALSVTLTADNLLWLRGLAGRTPRGSVSEVLDRLVTEARAAGRTDPASVRSVKGTVDLPEDDPDLVAADAFIRSSFAASVTGPMLLRETPPGAKGKRPRRG